MDLQSSNGTELNGDSLEPGKMTEILDKDVVIMEASDREFVVLKT